MRTQGTAMADDREPCGRIFHEQGLTVNAEKGI